MAADIFRRILGSRSTELECIPCVMIKCTQCGCRLLIHAGNTPITTRLQIPCPKCSAMVELTEETRNGKTTDVYMIKRDETVVNQREVSASSMKESPMERGEPVLGTQRTCDLCCKAGALHEQRYCSTCRQKMCTECNSVHKRMSVTRNHGTTECYAESVKLGSSLIHELMTKNSHSLDTLSSTLQKQTGLQVCLNVLQESVEVCAPTVEILELAEATLENHDTCPPRNGVHRKVAAGAVEWTFHGDSAIAVTRLFQDEITAVTDICDEVYTDESEHLSVHVYSSSRWDNATHAHPHIYTGTYNGAFDIQKFVQNVLAKGDNRVSTENKSTPTVQNVLAKGDNRVSTENKSTPTEQTTNEIADDDSNEYIKTVRCSFDEYHIVSEIMDAIESELLCLLTEVIVRPHRDMIRLALFVGVKHNDDEVVCKVEKMNDEMVMLKIQARDKDKLNDAKAEFLSLYCRECSRCQCHAIHPVYYECKHALCNDCIDKSHAISRITCPLCMRSSRSMVTSLQLLSLQALNRLLDRDQPGPAKRYTNRGTKSYTNRKQSAGSKPTLSIKIPKYLLNKWKRASGGIRRLKSLIENEFGLHVAGADDNLKLFGAHPDLLELAIATLEARNEDTPETGVSRRLTDKTVEWRFRGDYARIIRFLFKQELFQLPKRFQTVTLRIYTETQPSIVEIKCNYEQYAAVKYEVDELENNIKTLHADEYIQPKTFYYNVSMDEFIRAKSRDEKVFCEQIAKSNRNAVVIKARNKEFIQAAKEELVNW